MSRILGIDLGTTNSAMAVVNDYGRAEIIPNREGGRITPSVVLIDGSTSLVGEGAKAEALLRPYDTVSLVKRHMGERDWSFRSESGKSFSAEEISALILLKLKEDAEHQLGETIDEAVISVPAYFDDAGRSATMHAGQIAGLTVNRILNEPTAAAMAYGTDNPEASTYLVYDLGGGTFDVTIMRISGNDFEVLASAGDRNLGGFDWDNALMEWVDKEFSSQGGPSLVSDPDPGISQMLRDNVVRAKHTLTTRDEAKILLSAHGFRANIPVSRAQFADLTSSLLNRTARLVDIALESANLGWSEIGTVLLAGGSTRMTQVTDLITNVAGRRPSIDVNPDEVVALGAAVQGALEMAKQGTLPVPLVDRSGNRINEPRVSDITNHSLGVEVLTQGPFGQTGLENSILIHKGTRIPAIGTDDFATVSDYQTAWECVVNEGEGTELRFVNPIGTGRITLPGTYRANSPMRITLAYDINAIVHVTVQDLVSGNVIGELHVQRNDNLDPSEIASRAADIGQMEVL
jgi:molecular chaperone DnaK